MSGVTFRLGTSNDDVLIRNLLSGDLTVRPFPISFVQSPSFFTALRAQGEDPAVIVAESGGELVGVGAILKRSVYVNGRPETIGYLSALRVAPRGKEIMVLARGYQKFKRMHDETLRLPLYLTTIMKGNNTAERILTSGRAGLPAYQELGNYTTVLIPAFRGRKSAKLQGCQIESGEGTGASRILAALHELGSARQFFPVITESELRGGSGPFPGMRLQDLHVIRCAETVLGTLGVWDQRAFRQVVLPRNNPMITALRFLARGAMPLLGGPFLPRPGEPFSVVIGAWTTCRYNAAPVFRSLLSHVLRDLAMRRVGWLALGFFDEDPLLQVAREFAHLAMRSRLFRVDWEENGCPVLELDGRLRYLELGNL